MTIEILNTKGLEINNQNFSFRIERTFFLLPFSPSEKPGRCPMVTPGELGICSEECKDDTECDGYKKCCSNGCGHVCRDPYMVMNGT